MSASRVVSIMCDTCGRWDDRGVAGTAGAARKALAGTGWKLAVSGTDRVMRDYCPECVPRAAGVVGQEGESRG